MLDMSTKLVLKNLVKDLNVGAVTSTSTFAVKKVCRHMDVSSARLVVEYGPGTGPFTKYLLRQMRKDASLVAIELNEEFCKTLQEIDDPRLQVFHASAEDVRDVMEEVGEEHADYILSGIPFTLIPKRKRVRILHNSKRVLGGKGRFVAYQFSGLLKRYLAGIFDHVETDMALLNIPPLFIFKAYDARGNMR